MKTHRLAQGIVVVAAALGLVVLSVAPAAADPGTIVEGTIWFHPAGDPDDVRGTIVLPDPDGEPQCQTPLPSPSIDLQTTGTNTSGTWTASTPTPPGPIKTLWLAFPASGVMYQLDISILAATGTYTTAGAPPGGTHALSSTGPLHVILQLKLYRQTGASPFDCVKDDLRCTMNTRVLLQAGSGFDGTLPAAGSGETATLVFTSDVPGGTAVTPVGACNTELTIYAAKHVTGELELAF